MRLFQSISRGVFIVAILCAAPGVLLAQSALGVTFEPQSMIIHGVTPGARLAVFGVAREFLDKTPPVPTIAVRAEILVDEDDDGVVRLDLPVNVPQMGMWAIADLTSGAHAAFPTPGYSPQEVTIEPELLHNDNRNFVPDHQPVSALNRSGQAQRLYPHCIQCSRSQGGVVSQIIRNAINLIVPIL